MNDNNRNATTTKEERSCDLPHNRNPKMPTYHAIWCRT